MGKKKISKDISKAVSLANMSLKEKYDNYIETRITTAFDSNDNIWFQVLYNDGKDGKAFRTLSDAYKEADEIIGKIRYEKKEEEIEDIA